MRGSKAAAKPKKPAGHSIVNPSSKRYGVLLSLYLPDSLFTATGGRQPLVWCLETTTAHKHVLGHNVSYVTHKLEQLCLYKTVLRLCNVYVLFKTSPLSWAWERVQMLPHVWARAGRPRLLFLSWEYRRKSWSAVTTQPA